MKTRNPNDLPVKIALLAGSALPVMVVGLIAAALPAIFVEFANTPNAANAAQGSKMSAGQQQRKNF